MVEYSALTWVLVLVLALMSSVKMIPVNDGWRGERMSVIDLFLRAYQVHYDTYMYSLSLPF